MRGAVSNRSRLALFALLSLFVHVGVVSQSAAAPLTVNFAITSGGPAPFPNMPNAVTGGTASVRFPTASGSFTVAAFAPMTLLALSLSTESGGTFHLGSLLQGVGVSGTVTPALSSFTVFPGGIFPCGFPCVVTGSVGSPSQNTSIPLHSITGYAKGPSSLPRTYVSFQIFAAPYANFFVQGNEINRVLIPEPGSFGLFALGIIGVGMVAAGRRSRRFRRDEAAALAHSGPGRRHTPIMPIL